MPLHLSDMIPDLDPLSAASEKISLSTRHTGKATLIERDDNGVLVFGKEVTVDREFFGRARVDAALLPPKLREVHPNGLKWVRLQLRFNVEESNASARDRAKKTRARKTTEEDPDIESRAAERDPETEPRVATNQLLSLAIYPYWQQWHDVLLLRRAQTEGPSDLGKRLADAKSVSDVLQRYDAYPPAKGILTYDPMESSGNVVAAALPEDYWPIRFDDGKVTPHGKKYRAEFNSVVCLGILSPKLFTKKKGARIDKRFPLPAKSKELFRALVDEITNSPTITEWIDDFRRGNAEKPDTWANLPERRGDVPTSTETGFHELLLANDCEHLIHLAQEAAKRALSGPVHYRSYPELTKDTQTEWENQPVAQLALAILKKSVLSTDTCLKRPTEKRGLDGLREVSLNPGHLANRASPGYEGLEDATSGDSPSPDYVTLFERVFHRACEEDAHIGDAEERLQQLGEALAELDKKDPDAAGTVRERLRSAETSYPFQVTSILRRASAE